MTDAMLRRRAIMQGFIDPDGYAGGLIFRLDGIRRGGSEGYWTDLVGGVKFPVDESRWVTDGVTFNKNPIAGDYDTPVKFLTVEMVITATGSVNRDMVFVTSDKLSIRNVYNWFYFYPSKYVKNYMNCISNASLGAVKSQFMFSLGNICAVNGVSKNFDTSSMTVSSYITHGKIVIGGGIDAPNSLTGTIHALRIYGRNITAEEAESNLRLDNERFNLGLSL